MKIRNTIIGISLLASASAFGQGPMTDRIEVNLPYSITVQKTVLPPGKYVIRQHESTAGGSRILHFFADGGMKLETTAVAIPALDNKTPRKTELVLDQMGSDYYLNKIWVQGKDYGYEFPIPETVKSRERERNMAVTVEGQYKTGEEGATVSQQTATALETGVQENGVQETRLQETRLQETRLQETRKEERIETAQAAPTPTPVVEPEPAPTPVVEPEQTPAPVAQSEPAQSTVVTNTTENRIQADQRTMPSTAGNWLNFLIGGSLLAASGLALRRFQQS